MSAHSTLLSIAACRRYRPSLSADMSSEAFLAALRANCQCFYSSTTLKNCPRLRIEIPPTAFWTETPTRTLTVTSDHDLQSLESFNLRSRPIHVQKVNVKDRSVQRLEWKRKDGRTDGGDGISSRANGSIISMIAPSSRLAGSKMLAWAICICQTMTSMHMSTPDSGMDCWMVDII